MYTSLSRSRKTKQYGSEPWYKLLAAQPAGAIPVADLTDFSVYGNFFLVDGSTASCTSPYPASDKVGLLWQIV